MNADMIGRLAAGLSTPHIADSCVRLAVPLRLAPPGIRPLGPGDLVGGLALPVKIYGSVDIMLEAIDRANPGNVMVVDNGGRKDEGCIGDLTALEALHAGIMGIAVWGCHRDTEDLRQLQLPVFSYGAFPKGPTRDEPREAGALDRVCFGEAIVSRADYVFADHDGVIFVPDQKVREVIETAHAIRATERAQAQAARTGTSLRAQLCFTEYLHKRSKDPGYSFRTHLRSINGAIEE